MDGNQSGSKDQVPGFIPVLEEKLGIRVSFVELIKRSNSCFSTGKKIIPYLRISVIGEVYYELVTNPSQGLLNDRYFAKVRDLWREYIESTGADIDDCYDSKMYIGISSFDNSCFAEFAKTQKARVEEYFVNRFGVRPKKIYSSSLPGITVVYEMSDYKSLELADKTPDIQKDIIEIAKDYVDRKYGPLMCRLNVSIMHPKMDNYNSYGLSRED